MDVLKSTGHAATDYCRLPLLAVIVNHPCKWQGMYSCVSSKRADLQTLKHGVPRLSIKWVRVNFNFQVLTKEWNCWWWRDGGRSSAQHAMFNTYASPWVSMQKQTSCSLWHALGEFCTRKCMGGVCVALVQCDMHEHHKRSRLRWRHICMAEIAVVLLLFYLACLGVIEFLKPTLVISRFQHSHQSFDSWHRNQVIFHCLRTRNETL